jgi:AcrR family transcriptional regulator
VHQQGFNRSTLADIAERAEVPLGNVYYYFKTKDAIGEAVVARYAARYQQFRADWERHDDPRRRIAAFIDTNVAERAVLADYGCPIGTLNAELHKQASPLADHAGGIFADLLTWLAEQFRALGRSAKRARVLAVHVLSAVQGMALLAHVFNDPDLVDGEAQHLKKWIQTL